MHSPKGGAPKGVSPKVFPKSGDCMSTRTTLEHMKWPVLDYGTARVVALALLEKKLLEEEVFRSFSTRWGVEIWLSTGG